MQNRFVSHLNKSIDELKDLGLYKEERIITSKQSSEIEVLGSGKVLMKPAEKGHGIIAAGAVRAVMEAVGIMDISVKCLGSRNPNNLVRSTLEGLYHLRSHEWIASVRGKIFNKVNPQKDDKENKSNSNTK